MNYLSKLGKSGIGPAVMIGGGLAAVGIAWLAVRKSAATTDAIKKAASGAGPGPQADDVQPPSPPGGGQVNVRTTGYWPFTARADERAMEGGVFDRAMPSAYKNQPNSPQYKAHVLHTLEQHLSDPINHPFVSVSGDPDIWPYGQKIAIDAWPGAVFRVVDTGSHFHGAGKVYRMVGYEPLDICVNSSSTTVPKTATATIFPGDNFAKGAAVSTSKITNQTVLGYSVGAGGDGYGDDGYEERVVAAQEFLRRYPGFQALGIDGAVELLGRL